MDTDRNGNLIKCFPLPAYDSWLLNYFRITSGTIHLTISMCFRLRNLSYSGIDRENERRGDEANTMSLYVPLRWMSSGDGGLYCMLIFFGGPKFRFSLQFKFMRKIHGDFTSSIATDDVTLLQHSTTTTSNSSISRFYIEITLINLINQKIH